MDERPYRSNDAPDTSDDAPDFSDEAPYHSGGRLSDANAARWLSRGEANGSRDLSGSPNAVVSKAHADCILEVSLPRSPDDCTLGASLEPGALVRVPRRSVA